MSRQTKPPPERRTGCLARARLVWTTRSKRVRSTNEYVTTQSPTSMATSRAAIRSGSLSKHSALSNELRAGTTGESALSQPPLLPPLLPGGSPSTNTALSAGRSNAKHDDEEEEDKDDNDEEDGDEARSGDGERAGEGSRGGGGLVAAEEGREWS